MMTQKKAAMEMSIGTVVTIVLLMTSLILGLVLVRTIFNSGIENIKGIDRAVKTQINELFIEDNTRKVVVIPDTRRVIIKKGVDNEGFGFSIRNVGETSQKFSYSISAQEVSCGMRMSEAEDLITLGKQGNNIVIPAGNIMDNPIFIRFGIPESTPPCEIRYLIDVNKGTQPYGSSIQVDLIIEGK